MTDESAVYLYTGSESGYTAGNWYYYNGTAWTAGGTYGGAVTSTTFNQRGVPSDDFAVGEALAEKADADNVENIKLDLDSRTLINKKTLTSFPTKGGAFTNLYPDSAVQPYYLGGLNSNYAEFDCTINAGQVDFWVGMQVNADTSMEFIGINMRNADGNKLRKVGNNTSSTTVLNTTTTRTLLPVGASHVTAEIDANTFRIYCNGVMYSQFEIAESYTIKGLAFLNFGLVNGNISNLSVYDTLERISGAIITNNYINVTDDVVSENSWASFKDFPTNRIYGVNVSTANYASLGFPISRAGTFMCIRPWDLASTVYNYRTYIYVCNDAYEFTRAFICFGHGTTVTPWASIDTYGGAGYKNPLAEAMMDNNNKVCFIGDSIIAGLGGTGYDVSESGGGEYIMYRGFDRYTNIHGYCWVNKMIQHMTDVYGHTNVKNRGVGGISTKEVLDNWTTLLDGANTVVLSVGTNDYNNASRITTYLPQIAKECIKAGVKLMVMTNTPNNTADANKYNAVKGRIVAVCNTLGIPVYDMYSEFEVYLSLKGLTLADVLNSDGIHPNDTGYAIMFEIAKKLFQI